jgi:hypothetical protein
MLSIRLMSSTDQVFINECECKHILKELRVRHELPARHAIHLPAARAIRKIKPEPGSWFCSHPRRLHRLGRRRTERKCKCAVCSIATGAEFGIGGAHLTFGWRLCALHCERAAGREKLSGSRAVLLLLQLGRREIDDRPSQCHYTLPPSSTSSTSSGAPVCSPSAAPTPSILDTLINTRRVELSRLCLPECMYARSCLPVTFYYIMCRTGTTILPAPGYVTKEARLLSI